MGVLLLHVLEADRLDAESLHDFNPAGVAFNVVARRIVEVVDLDRELALKVFQDADGHIGTGAELLAAATNDDSFSIVFSFGIRRNRFDVVTKLLC